MSLALALSLSLSVVHDLWLSWAAGAHLEGMHTASPNQCACPACCRLLPGKADILVRAEQGSRRVLWRTVRERNVWLADVAAALASQSCALMAFCAASLADRCPHGPPQTCNQRTPASKLTKINTKTNGNWSKDNAAWGVVPGLNEAVSECQAEDNQTSKAATSSACLHLQPWPPRPAPSWLFVLPPWPTSDRTAHLNQLGNQSDAEWKKR